MRKLSGKTEAFVYVYVLLIGMFHLFTAEAGNFEAYLQRSIHLAQILPLAFVLWPMRKSSPMDRVPLYDWALAALSATPGIYSMIYHGDITTRIQQIDPLTTAQLVLGTLLVVLLLEGGRRIVGLPLSLIAALFVAYMLWGHELSGLLQGFRFSYEEVVEQLFLTDEGIFSMPIGVSATFVMIFLIFGAFLEKSGAGTWLMSVAQAFAGTTPGGPAQIAVVSSALFGSISGSAVANVYGTGTFTIPLMMRIGYEPWFAGAVEAVASSGGQIMPPVMGAGAFLMASFLGMQYRDVMIAALFPALLYYGALFLMVRLRALKMGLKGLDASELPSGRDVLRQGYMIAPLVGLIAFLLMGYTPMRAALIGIMLAWGVSFFRSRPDASAREKILAYATVAVTACLAALFAARPDLWAALAPTVRLTLFGTRLTVSGPLIRFALVCAWVLVASLASPGMGPRDVIDAVQRGARGIPLVCVACATAGIVLGAVALTGIGGKLVGAVISFAGDARLLALVLVMLIATFLGMGLPTTGAYILAAALGAPILVRLGFPPVAAHMFVFYYAIISNITPPVALAAYAASSIAGADPNRTGFQAMRLGFLAYVVPFAFCYDPGLLMQGSWTQIAWALVSGVGAVVAFACMWMGWMEGPLGVGARAALCASGVLCLAPGPMATTSGLVLLVAIWAWARKRVKGAVS
ncbi:MAG: TRAP transporter fused permease subunit [Synergistaceae bacterium]|nr:TRAP transporter fused permease subunit [Synergistaceae bacterium]